MAKDRAKKSERIALFVMCSWATFWVANNFFPYFGLRDDSCQTMFSSLDCHQGRNNHLVMPQHMVWDGWQYVTLSDVFISGFRVDFPDDARMDWLRLPNRAFNMEALRVNVSRLCEHHQISFTARSTETGESIVVRDACSSPSFSSPSSWIPVRLYETDYEKVLE